MRGLMVFCCGLVTGRKRVRHAESLQREVRPRFDRRIRQRSPFRRTCHSTLDLFDLVAAMTGRSPRLPDHVPVFNRNGRFRTGRPSANFGYAERIISKNSRSECEATSQAVLGM